MLRTAELGGDSGEVGELPAAISGDLLDLETLNSVIPVLRESNIGRPEIGPCHTDLKRCFDMDRWRCIAHITPET